MKRYLSLVEGTCFVPGKRRGAIYDLKRGILYALDERMTALFYWSSKGLSYPSALQKIKCGKDVSSLIEYGLKKLAFVRFREEFKPFPPLDEFLIKKREDRQGVWLDIAQECNLRCIHCYANAGQPLKDELSLEEWKRVIDELFEIGYTHLTVGGGEPFFYPGIVPLLRYILSKRPASLCVLTNGALLNNKVLNFLSDSQIDLNITIYSHLPEHHDRISGVKGSWRKTVAGIKGVIKKGIPYSVNIPLGAINQDDLKETLDFLGRVGVREGLAGGNIVYPLGRGENGSVLPGDYTKFNLKRETYQLPLTGEGRLFYQTCWCGKLLIKPEGGVSPCPSAREDEFIVGNVREKPLQEIVNDERLHYFWGLVMDDIEICRDCEFRYGCHDCRANAWIYSHNLFGKNPYCLYDPQKGAWMEYSEKNIEEEIKKEYWVKTRDYKTHRLDDELAILDEESGAIHMLNQLGAEIYNLLDGKHSFAEIMEMILKKYDVEEERSRVDILNVLKKLRELGIVSCQKKIA